MANIHAEYSMIIPASPEKVYGIIADYHEGHHQILPPKYFSKIEVEEGGQGAGTVIKVEMNVLGVKQSYRMIVSEPELGRVIQEEDREAGVKTTFTIEPNSTSDSSKVTISTQSKASSGFKGMIEKWMNPMIMRKIYKEELELLAKKVIA